MVRRLQIIHLPNAFLVLSLLTVLSLTLSSLYPVALPTKMHDTYHGLIGGIGTQCSKAKKQHSDLES